MVCYVSHVKRLCYNVTIWGLGRFMFIGAVGGWGVVDINGQVKTIFSGSYTTWYIDEWQRKSYNLQRLDLLTLATLHGVTF